MHLGAVQCTVVHRLQNFANAFVIWPILLLLVFAEVADHLASAAHLQVADLVRDRTDPEPVASVSVLN